MNRLPRVAFALVWALALGGSAAAFGFPKLHPATGTSGAASQAAPAPKLKSGEWPQSRSDLKADPNIRFGVLPNGMRYAIMRNATPPGEASLRLRFAAGSMMETDAQQGLAHFLEHMAFNGSRNVPDRGEMVKILQRHGLAFGADTNAQTGFNATTYKLDLPTTDDDTVDTSLMLLREAAGNLDLRQEDIDKERGVILSEERLRDTPAYRITKSRLDFLMAGQRPPRRFPIGLVPVIQNAQRAQIADFYAKYYRPERATLIAVGDFDPVAMEAKIKVRFSDWTGQGAPGADPDLGKVAKRGDQYRIAVEEGAATSFELAWVTAPDLSPDTVAKRRRQWIERLGLAVLNRRLATLARADDPPFIAAGAFRGNQLQAARITGVLVTAQPDHWQNALGAAETEVRQAVKFGVRPDELSREVAEQTAALQLAADGAATRRTPALADEIAGALDDNSVETSPADDLALFKEAAKGLTAEAVSAALKNEFEGEGPLVFMSSPRPVDGGEAALRGAFKTATAGALTPPDAPRTIAWPYSDFGTPGKVAAQTEIPDLDAVFVRFTNGVRLTVKQTKFSETQVLVRVRFGDGLSGMAPDRQSMAWSGLALSEGGLSQISADDAERALAGQVYGVDFGAEDDAFTLGGETRSTDLETQLQVLAAYVSQPAWRPEAYQRIKQHVEVLENQYQATDSGVLGRDLPGLMHGGDRRWTFPNLAEVQGETLDDLKSQVAPALASGPIEITIVGDITIDKAIAAVADTFGALLQRPDPGAPGAPAHGPAFPAPTVQPVARTHTGRADQAIGFMAWPTDDYFANPQAARVNTILGEVMQLRLIDVLRLKEGVTYSPAARSSASLVWPHWGYVSAQVEAPPDKLAGFFADAASIAADLRNTEVSADELERAKKPRIEALQKAVATNEYWLNGLAGAQRDPRRLDVMRSAEAGLERVSADDVRKAAQTYLRDDRAWKLVVRAQ
jgi:zinc protease